MTMLLRGGAWSKVKGVHEVENVATYLILFQLPMMSLLLHICTYEQAPIVYSDMDN